MSGPEWLPDCFAALMIVTAAYCAGRVAACRLLAKQTDVGADLLHLLMGIAMAGMFEPALSPLPGTIWRAAFAASAVWFGWQAIRPGRPRRARLRCVGPVPHAVESAAMTYVFFSVTPPGGAGVSVPMANMMAMAGNLPLTVVLAVYMIGYTLWTADLLASPASPPPGPPGASIEYKVGQPALAPRLASCYKITMGVAMSYMLITML